MLVKTLLIALVSFIGFLECGVGNSMIQRPIVMGPLVGLVLGDVNAGLAVGATLELAFMGNVTIGAAEVKVDGSSYRCRRRLPQAAFWVRRWPLFPEMAQRLPLHWHCPLQRWLC